MSPLPSAIVQERLLAQSPFKIDEGYSGDTRSENGSPEPHSMLLQRNDAFAARRWLLDQPNAFRAAVARELLLSLPNSTVSDIVHEANGRLHFDPVLCLPIEIMSEVFEYLSSEALLNASKVSKSWRDLALEPPLWRRLFGVEGWTFNRDNVRSFEDKSRSQIEKIWSNPRVRQRPSDFGLDRMDAKRPRLHSPPHESVKNVRLWVEHGCLDVPPEWTEPMQASRVGLDKRGRPVAPGAAEEEDALSESEELDSSPTSNVLLRDIPEQTICPLLQPSRLIDTFNETPRPNWHWIFKQRRRLEKNWNAGRFTNFRLPRLDHKEEGHTQCVYTLQFSAKHVVSGSRDKTVRVWDLATQRLKMAPLVGHSGSVLCLQFDERHDRDLIISGSSDADVMIWKFSTGKLIKRLRRAHAESVLNLRFDDRYLVTCSKDKTIKLWNMKELCPSDLEYPRQNKARNAHYPDYIVDLASFLADPHLDLIPPLPVFSLIMTLEGHNAAVNAIQIFQNHIVSASGDRKIILWDLQAGELLRVFGGHSKGIACVQYDGRRIVSGSSDNSVRIFDSATGAEVARLQGHAHLVRTVQAEFGDMYDDDDVLELEARENDRQILDDRTTQMSAIQPSAGSRRHFVFGAKLPPGGGGNRWSKIVSGSYDQSVIIWRRDKEGTWKIAKQLRQEEALRATAGFVQEVPANGGPQTSMAPPRQQLMNTASILHQPVPPPPNWRSDVGRQAVSDMRPYSHQQSARSVYVQEPNHLQQENAPPSQSFSPHESTQAGPSNLSTATSAPKVAPQSSQPHEFPHLPAMHMPEAWQTFPRSDVAQALPHPPTFLPAHFHPQHPQIVYQPPPPPSAWRVQHQQLHQHLPNHFSELLPAPVVTVPPLAANFREGGAEEDASRVFRLQFDARRIISSSQLPVIVGWDFANGDRDIEEASQFFGEPA